MTHQFGIRRTFRGISFVLATTGIVGASPGALAQYDATAYIPNGHIIGETSTPGDVTYSYGSGTNVSAMASFTANPVASVTYSTNVFNPSGTATLSGGGIMTYRFEVAAQPFEHVPVDFSGIYSSSTSLAGPGYGAFTSFSVQTVNSSVSTYSSFESHFEGNCGGSGCLQYIIHDASYTSSQSDPSHLEGTFSGALDMLTGANGTVIGSVQLFAGAGANIAFVPGSAHAYIDPHLEIDALFLAANPGATLTLTPGVGNAIASVSAVPEPETYALMLAGLAAMTSRVRRRAPPADSVTAS